MEEAKNTVPEISVLMPVYNVKDYVEYAVNSVLAQTFRDFELILLNDGSTDGSAAILERYAQQDSRIRVHHIENGGLANARNVLLSLASGKYIAFIDSDDAIKENYLETLYHNITEYDADISIVNYYHYVEKERMYYFFLLKDTGKKQLMTGLELLQQFNACEDGYYNNLLAFTHCKLFKKELFTGIYFPTGKLHEDAYTTYKLMLKSERVIYESQQLYMYRQRDDSISGKVYSSERIRNIIEFNEERLALFTALHISVPENYIKDYVYLLQFACEKAKNSGYIELYRWIRQKLDLIDSVKKLQSDQN